MDGFQQERAGNHSQAHLAFVRMSKLGRRERSAVQTNFLESFASDSMLYLVSGCRT